MEQANLFTLFNFARGSICVGFAYKTHTTDKIIN